MPLCGASGCGKMDASLRCARCQGVFYCSASCQKSDWSQHKRLCKKCIPGDSEHTPVGVYSEMPPRPTLSSSDVDFRLFKAIASAASAVRQAGKPKKLASAITDAISNVRPLLEAGARADVLLPSTLVAVRLPEIQSSAMEMLCKVPALAPLLKLVLEETKEKALNVNFSWMCDNFSGRPQLVSPMGMAAHHHNVAAMHLLLKHGCDPRLPCAVTNLRDEIFYPLHYAAWDLRNENATLPQLVEVAEALVAHGADVNAKSIPHGRSALHLGIMALRPVNERKAGIPVDESLGAVVLWLLDHGADVHAIREDTRERPLDMALVRGAIYVCDALLARGADPHPVPFIGGTHGEFLNAGLHYLDLAISADLVDVLRFAAKAGVKLEKVMSSGFIHLPLLSAALEAHAINCARYLLVEYRPRDRNPRSGDDAQARNNGAETAEATAEEEDDDDEGVGVDLNVPFLVPAHQVGVHWTERPLSNGAARAPSTSADTIPMIKITILDRCIAVGGMMAAINVEMLRGRGALTARELEAQSAVVIVDPSVASS